MSIRRNATDSGRAFRAETISGRHGRQGEWKPSARKDCSNYWSRDLMATNLELALSRASVWRERSPRLEPCPSSLTACLGCCG